MRLRRSTSFASGMLMRKGRIASALVVAICKSPCFDCWLGRALPAAARCMGRRLAALAAAARSLRRVGENECAGMISLPGQREPVLVNGNEPANFNPEDDGSGARDQSYV